MKAAKQLTALILGACGIVSAQIASRADLIESARTQKEANLTPETPPQLETRIESIEHSLPYRLLTGGIDGFGVGFGNVVPGAGLAAGPQYTRTGLWNGRLDVTVQARASINESYLGRMDVSLPNLFGDRVFLDFSAAHRNISEMPYYGPGPDSRKTGRSDYRLEDTNRGTASRGPRLQGPARRTHRLLPGEQRRPGAFVPLHFERAAVRSECRARHRPADEFLARRRLRRIRLARPTVQSHERRQVFGAVRPLPGPGLSAHTAFYGWIWTPRSTSRCSIARG